MDHRRHGRRLARGAGMSLAAMAVAVGVLGGGAAEGGQPVSEPAQAAAERAIDTSVTGVAAVHRALSSGSEQPSGQSTSPALEGIAQCESGGDPGAIGGGGEYRGKYQMTREAWAGVGGSGDPAAAPDAEQDRRAAMLYQRGGASQWPGCGQ